MIALAATAQEPAPCRVLLSEVFERQFIPDNPKCAADVQYASQFRRAIELFGVSLGRPAVVADLAREPVAAFRELLVLKGDMKLRQELLYQRICQLWRYACRIGLIDRFDPPHRKTFEKPPDLPAPEPGTVRHFFETVYRPQQVLNCTAAHTADLRSMLGRLREHYGRDILLSELTDSLAADHLVWMLARGIEPVSVNNRHRAPLFAVWRLAHQRGLVAAAPLVKKLKEHQDEPDAWTHGELQRMVAAAAGLRPGYFVGGFPVCHLLEALLTIGWWAPVRKSSLLSIRRDDVDLIEARVSVRGKSMKNRRGQSFKIGQDAVEVIRRIWLPERELLFPRIHPRLLHNLFLEVLAAAGVAPSKRKNLNQWHKLRRTVATHATKAAGIQFASELLGHSAAIVTERYVDPSQLPSRDGTRFLAPLGPAKSPPPRKDAMVKAQALILDGLNEEAAMQARIALWNTLRSACETTGPMPRRRSSVRHLAESLYSRQLIERTMLSEISRIAHIGNRAAHGCQVTLQQAAELIDGVRSLRSNLEDR
jgi:integrase